MCVFNVQLNGFNVQLSMPHGLNNLGN